MPSCLSPSFYFNPRLREGGDFCPGFWLLCPEKFQSTPPRRRRQATIFSRLETKQFQSTPPRRRRHFVKTYVIISVRFQSTPPRRRRRKLFADFNIPLYISIHASAKEATCKTGFYEIGTKFQSTPPRRRRLCTAALSITRHRFQSTPPRRRRRCSS